MRIGWRTITALQHFLCERQNALVKKKVDLKDISFQIKRGKLGDLLEQINEDICRNNPISPDSLESILSIFVKDGLIEPIGDSKDRFMVSEEVYKLSSIEMAKPKKSPAVKKETVKKEEKMEEEPPQPIRWIMSEQERIAKIARIARPKAIAQFEKGILLYHKGHYQEAIIEFQKVIDNFNMVIDVTYKAKQYMEFCKNDLRKSKARERRAWRRGMRRNLS